MPTIRTEIFCQRGAADPTNGDNASAVRENSKNSKRRGRQHSQNSDADSTLNVSQNNPEDADPASLDPFREGYDARGLVEQWYELPPRLTMSDWACYIRTTRRRSQRNQIDRLVADVCTKVLGMRELTHYTVESGYNCLMWLSFNLSRQYIAKMRKGAQIIGRLSCDIIVKDKQSLSNLLNEYSFKEWIEYPTHVCFTNNEEIRHNVQRLCRHQYIGHYMEKCMDNSDGKCPNQNYYFCECFRRQHFVPEYFTFSHHYRMEEFLKRFETDKRFQDTVWLAKPAYLTSGKGFFLIRNAREFRYFYLVRSDTCVRREGYLLQRYLTRTCTFSNCKVDFRMYLLVVVLNGRRVCGFFHPGYTQSAAAVYTIKPQADEKQVVSDNVFEHLTSSELMKLMGTGAGSDEEEEARGQCLPFNEACDTIETGAKRVRKGEAKRPMAFATEDEEDGGKFEKFHMRFKFMIEAICDKLDPLVRDKPGTFQIFGLDILLDSDLKPWLLEINSHVATEQVYEQQQSRVISNVVTEAICLVCELLQKSIQEEELAIEIQQGNCRLSNLTRAQRLLTAKDAQLKLDELQKVLEKTEISQQNRPIFLQNFFWWYETPRHRWFKPWQQAKKAKSKEPEWYSRMFAGLLRRSEVYERKILKAETAARLHDSMDYFHHSFWPSALEKQMKDFETNQLSKREQMVKKAMGGSDSKASGSSPLTDAMNDQDIEDQWTDNE